MRLHLPILVKRLNSQSILERCTSCKTFEFEISNLKGQDGIYLGCKCHVLPRFFLAKVKMAEQSNKDLQDIIIKQIKAKKNCWNKLVSYSLVANKNW